MTVTGLNAAQQTVAAFVADHDIEAPITARLLDLVSEVGELAKEVLTHSAYGRAPFAPSAGWTAELGDVTFALLCLAHSTGIDLDAALAQTLEKYTRRLAATGAADSGR
ncbi:MAG: nucleotide pyrophosphohydrolase [Anaerolineae bacterium]|nr:nucleotide pyrophosphohydrolase [Anaerolineae bacterium]